LNERNINGLVIDAVLEERERHELVVTEHPVELRTTAGSSGDQIKTAAVADHAYELPTSYTMTGIIADQPVHPLGALKPLTQSSGLAETLSRYAKGIAGAGATRSRAGYEILLDLFQSQQVFEIQTELTLLEDMLITSISTTTDKLSESAVFFEATLRRIDFAVPAVTDNGTTVSNTSDEQAATQAVDVQDQGSQPTTLPSLAQTGAIAVQVARVSASVGAQIAAGS
jgi:hypothetical protein